MESAIVCVDDDWDVLKSLGEQLKRNFGRQYVVELAQSGDEAISICQELSNENTHIALIISDQNMVGMGGDELLIQLHRHYPKSLKIMLTGEADADAVGNVINHGALYRYLSKPWKQNDLLLTVTEALKRFEQELKIQAQKKALIFTSSKLEHSLSILLATLNATADAILVLDHEDNLII